MKPIKSKNTFLKLKIVALLLGSQFCYAQMCSNNSQAEFKNRIIDIENYLEKQKSIDIIKHIKQIEEVTKIESESDVNYFGKMNPSKQDLEKWSEWFEANKKKICYNTEKDFFYLIK